ncbi:unnamed protein product [Taenia asiatica]|uniref:Nuclear pore membrane glycoprotein n=1 Tax=Taenia asiatica TaxID=60517 RepID=A0A158R7X1_TAEAS|nr:unnamed protein product [Taenia asiatica]
MVLCACFAFLLALGITTGVDFKLSDSKLLLPYFSSASVNYTITGSGHSCYEWWSGSPEVVAVLPVGDVGERCTNKASVTAIWQSALRRTSTIYALTRHVLECDVIVDDIHSIKIDTTTQELYLHNTPASLVVIGYDEFGNTFSSLDGIPFEWKIHTGYEDLKTTGDGVLRFLTWTESEYTTPSRIGLLEAEGMQGYMQLVSGLRTGSAVVSAALRESAYSHVPSAKVRLLVMAKAQLNPPALYLIPNSLARFQVNVVRQDADEEVVMPSRQYYLSVADGTVIELDSVTGSIITAQKYGQTTVTLLDRNIEEAIKMLGSSNSDGNDTETQMLAHHRRPTSIVYVVEPAYFRFTVQPVGEDARLCVTAARQSLSQIPSQGQYNHWTLEIGKTYKLSLDLYDQNNHRIFPADNIRISVVFPDSAFNVSESAENGTVFTIVPHKKGTFTIKSTLEGVMAKTGEMKLLSHPVTGSQEMIVYPPLTVFPNQVNVAWDVSVNISKGYALAAEGGSGDYVWTALPASGFPPSEIQTSKANEVVTISSEGILFAKGIGTALVVVSDLRNPSMCSHSAIRVGNVASLNFSPGRAEVYLPRQSLSDDEGRLASLLSARFISLDLRDLVPDPIADEVPLDKHGKINNAILSVGLKAQDVEGNPLTYCHNLPIQVRPKDSSMIKVLPGIHCLPPSTEGFNYSGVCAFVRVVGLRVGFTELEVLYSSGENPEEHVVHARSPIAVYRDISFLPSTAVVAVAVGSSRRISCINGPIPWHLDAGSHFVKLDFTEPLDGKRFPSVLQQPQSFALQNSSISGHNFVLRCESLGNFKAIVIVGNRPSSTNPLPAVLSAVLSVICDVPSKIELIPHLDLPTLSAELPPCPIINRSLGNSDDIIPISNNAPLTVEVAFKGFSGHELSGVDSIGVRTRITSDTEKVGGIVSTPEPVVLGLEQIVGTNTSAKPYFFVTPRTLGESAGLLHVHVVADYHWPGEQSGILESVLTLKMAPQVTIEPLDDFQLLLHPKAFASVHLSHGSGFFHFDILPHEPTSKLPSKPCLSVLPSSRYEGSDQESQRDFLLSPKCRGKVTIRATDLCFPARLVVPEGNGPKPRRIGPSSDDRVVSIVGLGSLRLYAPSQLELLSKVHAYVRAFDTEGNVLSAQFVNLLDLQVISSGGHPSETKSVMAATCPDSLPGSNSLGLASESVLGTQLWLPRPTAHLGDLPGLAKLNLCGQELGPSKLKVISGSVTSNVEIVNVYAPLSLEPCNLNLLLGAAHQMVTAGGPSSSSVAFQVTPDYSGRPKLSVKVFEEGDKSGILMRAELGRVGSATVLANATSPAGYVGLDTLDFNVWGLTPPPAILSSKTSCRVNVVALSGVRIGCPLPTPNLGGEGRILVASANGSSSVGGVPVWAEGVATVGENGVAVTPMGLADIQPPLHFSWRLSPPMPNSPAHLFHWLSHLNVEPDDTSLSSGIVVVGVAAGQVKLHLTVFTEGGLMTGQLTSPDSHGTSQPVKQLSAEITFSVVPRLTLLNPFRQNPRILVSPNSRLQLIIPSHILADGGAQYSIKCPGDSPTDMLRVTPSGLLESGVSGRCGAWSDWRLSQCRCHLRVDYHPTSASSAEHNEHSRQSLALDVVVKAPLYALACAQLGPYILPKGSSGLPFGGPYPITLSFHDELGEMFDAVAEDLLSIRLSKHRSGLLDYSVESGGTGSHSPVGRLMLQLIPPLHTDLSSLQAATTLELTHDPLPGTEESAALAPGYLTIPIGSVLDVHGILEFTVGQWACLPLLPQGDGVWSSSDPNLLWIDNQSKFMLPLRAGHVHLQFTPKTKTGVQTSLLGKLTLKNICSKSDAYPQSRSSASSIMPVGMDLAQEVPIHFTLAPVASAVNSSCASTVAWSALSEISPLTCSARLELGVSEGHQARWVLLPNWLRVFLLAERYATALSLVVEPDLMAALSNPVLQSADFHTQLIPSPLEEGAWTCIVRPGDPGDYSRLAVLPYGSRLVVEVKGSCGAASDGATKEVITRSELTLAPAFRVLVPLMHLSNSEPLILTPRTPIANLVVFIPPATLTQMESGVNVEQALKARSQRPDLLAIASAPRPVYSASHVKAALEHMAGESGYSSGMGALYRNLSLMMENEAQASPEQAFGNGLIWVIGVKSLPTKAAVDTIVEVVLSLKLTGQHVSVPVHVRTRGLRAGELLGIDVDGEKEEAGYGLSRETFWVNLSWFNLLLLIFLTILLLIASHVVTRSLSGSGLGVADEQKNLPPLSSTEDASSRGSPQLWSQGYGLHGRGNFAIPSHVSPKFRTFADSVASSPFGDTLGLHNRERVATAGRPRESSSPSRLREAFDNSL